LTKPAKEASSLGFVASRERLNVALSRAQKVLIVVGNMAIWNEQFLASVKNISRAKMLRELLVDVRKEKHVLTWADRRTVTEVDPEPNYVYVSHVEAPRQAQRLCHQCLCKMLWTLTSASKSFRHLEILPASFFRTGL
jgi:hypothetical protein